MQQTDYERRGYLHEDFRLFHLSSALAEDTAFHYHEFHKLVFFLAGRGNYIVEGRTHVLRPYDVVLVRQGAIHKAQIDPSQRYERVILYISPEFLRTQSTADSGQRAALLRTLGALEAEEQSTAYGHDLLARAQMLQLLVMLGRGLDDDGVNYAPSEHCNEKTAAILEYLNTHLTEDVSIDALADTFYLSKYYMMRMFRAETGFTIHGYLTDKRLRVARDLIAQGMRTTDACFQCGYHDYSAFSRAYKKRFQVSPRADLTKGVQ